MKNIGDVLPRLNAANKAWVTIGPQKHGWTVEKLRQKLREWTKEDVDPKSIEAHLRSNGISPGEADLDEAEVDLAVAGPSQFSGAMEKDIELALVAQLDSLGLKLFVDESGRNGRQYPAGEFGRIDVLAVDLKGDFVVIELKREDVPRATIGQVAGYIAFVRKILAKPNGRSVVGWILARPSSDEEDRILGEAAEAVGIVVKWYWVRIELLEGRVQ